MTTAGLKAMAGHRKLKLGHFIVEFATPGIGYILKNAGCEFALLDTEHPGKRETGQPAAANGHQQGVAHAREIGISRDRIQQVADMHHLRHTVSAAEKLYHTYGRG